MTLSLSDSIKNAADNKAKVQVIRDIVAKIPGTGTDSHREANEDNKFADIATDPINSLRMSNTKLFYYGF